MCFNKYYNARRFLIHGQKSILHFGNGVINIISNLFEDLLQKE